MIIYSKTWLKNLQIRSKARLWFAKELITEEERNKIDSKHPAGFYMPGFWISAGLFFFTTILLFASGGFLVFIIESSGAEGQLTFRITAFLFSGACLFFTEKYKKQKHYYQAGTDNALLWAGLGSLTGNIFWTLYSSGLPDSAVLITGSLLASVICGLATIRYADPFMTFCAFAFGLLTLLSVIMHISMTGKALVPYAGFLYAFLIYYFTKNVHEPASIYYDNCLVVLEVAALLSAYLSVNYFIVRELNMEMFSLVPEKGKDIPFGLFFTFLTIAMPLVYICFGLKKKDRKMIRMGLLLVSASVLTIRYYYAVLPMETAMISGGVLLVAVSYFLMRWLHVPKFGFTVIELIEENGLKEAEGLLITQTFSPDTTSDNTRHGRGSFGGGGSTGSF